VTSWCSPVRRMPDSVALVTGASRGIGRAIAVSLADAGYAIGINYASNGDEAKETLRLVEAAGSEGVCIQADVGDPEAIEACFTEVEAELGLVSALVNNAGVRADGLALSMKDDAWDRVLRTNLYGTFACSRRALRSMLRSRKGRIVNVSSIAGLNGSSPRSHRDRLDHKPLGPAVARSRRAGAARACRNAGGCRKPGCFSLLGQGRVRIRKRVRNRWRNDRLAVQRAPRR
jgi:NAD(P)-dependent dehydrogenase (short-subunit alcohol dehydrogenase family)